MHKPVSEHNQPSSFTVLLRDANIEKFAVAGLVILIAYAVVRNLVGAATRPFWYDEVCTWIVTRQPSLSAIWNALAHAADAQAPGFYLIERISAAFIRNQEIAFRLPSILGFCCITICLFVFTRRHAGGAFALVCAAIPFTTSLFNWYAIEARPYSLLVACIAIALVAYQRAPIAAWMLVMCLALAASIALNYYAVFAMVPFGLAELYVLLVRRQIRWRVWIALACGVVPLAVFWPLLAKLKQYYGEHFWSGASLSGLIHIYGAFFMSSPPFGAAIAAAALLGMMGLIVLLALNPESAAAQTTTPAREYVLVVALVGLPAIGFLVAKLTHSGMTERYVLPAVVGISLAAGCILPLLDRKSVILAVGFLVALLAVQEASFWVAHKHQLTTFESPADSLASLVTSVGYQELPVVISDGLEYLPIAYYAAPPWSERFVFLADPSTALIFAGNESLDKELIVLRSFAPLRVYDYSAFALQQRTFLLYSSNGSGGDPQDWWAERLLRDGNALRVLAADHRRTIYLVTRRQESP
jgi:4-amino-4-deoxy-L-arabinose transferase-like glycosyltransferase